MNRGIELTGIHPRSEDAWYAAMRRAREEQERAASNAPLDFDEDDLERPINPDGAPDSDSEDDGESAPPPPQTAPDQEAPVGVYFSVMVFENDIRELYPRRHREGRPGTRIVYRSGAPRLVKESYEEVKAKFAALAAG